MEIEIKCSRLFNAATGYRKPTPLPERSSCQRQQQIPGEQNMLDLPVDRITADLQPFMDVGLRPSGGEKRFGGRFTCSTSALHLEVAVSWTLIHA